MLKGGQVLKCSWLRVWGWWATESLPWSLGPAPCTSPEYREEGALLKGINKE